MDLLAFQEEPKWAHAYIVVVLVDLRLSICVTDEMISIYRSIYVIDKKGINVSDVIPVNEIFLLIFKNYEVCQLIQYGMLNLRTLKSS